MNIRNLAIVIVIVVAAAWLGVQTWNAWTDTSGPDYEYLECIPTAEFGEDVTTVSGCAEIVEIAGASYIRTTDVGKFTVFFDDGAKTFTVGPAHLDLFLQTGQSNSYVFSASGFWPDSTALTPGADAPSPIKPGTAFYVGVETHTATEAGFAKPTNYDRCRICDITGDDGTIRIANTYPTFLYDYNVMTGHRVMMLNSGIGGLGIGEFMPGCQLYERTVQVCELAKSLMDPRLFVTTPVAVLWSQGEADASMNAATYESKLIRLTERFDSGEFGFEWHHLVTVLPRSPTVPSPTGAAEGQIMAAEDDGRITVASSIALNLHAGQPYFRDTWHYTQPVYNWLGEAFAREVAEISGTAMIPESIVICQTTGDGEPPTTVSAIGTTGEAYSVTVAWEDADLSEPGTYTVTGTIVKTPDGTIAAPGLVATAIVTIEGD